jgi:predicted nucleic-acid-binding Zn-ribbon protein
MKSTFKRSFFITVLVGFFFTIVSCSLSTTPIQHEHTFIEDVWEYDEYYHWHAATCSHKDEVIDKNKHNFVNNVCIDCGYRIDYSTARVGDIILANGVVRKYEEFNPDTDIAAAVIVKAKTSTTPAYGIGIELLIGSWCDKTSLGYKKVNGLIGLNTGRNAFGILSAACSDAGTYQAWRLCREYGNSFEANIKDGWYLPAPLEYSYIYSNLSTINHVLSSVLKVQEIKAYTFWTCCQHNTNAMDNCAVIFMFYDGSYKYGADKSNSYCIFPMKCFE